MRNLYLITILIFIFGCIGPFSKSPPSYGKIYEAYYVCEKSKSLVGGIFGKGPIRNFGKNENSCFRDQWEKIDKQTFKDFAVQWYEHDWDTDIPFWQN
jgi:hypothetical protein